MDAERARMGAERGRAGYAPKFKFGGNFEGRFQTKSLCGSIDSPDARWSVFVSEFPLATPAISSETEI
jgi:hypothetical protein